MCKAHDVTQGVTSRVPRVALLQHENITRDLIQFANCLVNS